MMTRRMKALTVAMMTVLGLSLSTNAWAYDGPGAKTPPIIYVIVALWNLLR